MPQKKLLDLFCGAGGCSMGYHRAGFEVVGIDNKPQKNHPFEFVQADAFEALEKFGKEFDVIHASPPCQEYSVLTKAFRNKGKKYPDLISKTRDLLKAIGKPYIIENVKNAPLKNNVMLCGTMFGLRVYRHRYFECFPEITFPPVCCNHSLPAMNPINSKGWERMKAEFGKKRVEYHFRDAMGVNWIQNREAWRQSIPPAYTEWIGNQILLTINEE